MVVVYVTLLGHSDLISHQGVLLREHKEVDPFFSSPPFSSRCSQGLYSHHCSTIYLRSSLLSLTVRVEVSGRDRSVILLSYMIAYLLLREHKEVDPLFSSLPSSSRWSQGLQSQHSSTIHVRSSLLWVLATASSWLSSPSSRASTLDPSAHRVERPFLPFDNTLMILRSTSDLNNAACFACLPHLIPKLSGNHCFR